MGEESQLKMTEGGGGDAVCSQRIYILCSPLFYTLGPRNHAAVAGHICSESPPEHPTALSEECLSEGSRYADWLPCTARKVLVDFVVCD